jgi:hypothetical protein
LSAAAGRELHHELGGVGGLDAHHERRTIGPGAHAAAPVAATPAAPAVPRRVGGRPPKTGPIRGPLKRPPQFPIGANRDALERTAAAVIAAPSRLGRLW